MSTAADTRVEHVAGYTKPARILRCTREAAELETVAREAYADPDGAEKPELTMSARRPEDVGGLLLTRARAPQRYSEPFWGSMRGRVRYVVSYELATRTSLAEAGVQITDDAQRVRRAPRYGRSLHARHAKCAPAICCFVVGRAIRAPAVAGRADEIADRQAQAEEAPRP